jgi:hypothetical protein
MFVLSVARQNAECRTIKKKTQVRIKYRVQENKKKIPLGAWMCVSCDLYFVRATSRSLVQSSLTDCGV